MTVRDLHTQCPSADLGRAEAAQAGLPASRDDALGEAAVARSRLRAVIDRHYDFVWRTIRYFGVADASIEDAAQEVVCVLARRIEQIEPGSEMSFLFSTATRVASNARRSARRQPETTDVDVDALVAILPSPEELVDELRAQNVLSDVLDSLPVDLRVVFVLFEIEELTLAEIAAMLAIPAGTVASRLRRAREAFRSTVRRMHAADGHAMRGGGQ